MNDPYATLGVSPSASDEEIKKAYRELARKYHPDNYQDNPLADLAEEKMKEINEAYELINRQRSSGSSYAYQTQSGPSAGPGYRTQSADPFSQRVRQAIQMGDLNTAERILTQEATVKNAEWYFLMGAVCYRRGWLDDARQNYQMAVQMDPNNMEYQQAYAMMNRGGYAYQPYSRNDMATSDACDCCTTLMCLNCLCGNGGRC